MEIPGGKVLGATIIPNLEENESQTYGKTPEFFFSIVIGKIDNQSAEVCFFVRNSLKPQITITKEDQKCPIDDKHKFLFKFREPGIVQMPAQNILFQMLLSGQINKESMNNIRKKIIEK